MMEYGEARILPLSEVKIKAVNGEACWIELPAGIFLATIIDKHDDAWIVIKEFTGTRPYSEYGRTWRCWSRKPNTRYKDERSCKSAE